MRPCRWGYDLPIRLLIMQVALVLGSASCGGDGFGPEREVVPPLEDVPFEAIGTGKVMFVREGGLGGTEYSAVYLIDADARRSDTVDTWLWAPSLSPAGDKVAYLGWTPTSTDPDGCYDVYRRDLSGGDPSRLSSFSCNSEGPPSWLPDGSGVAFVVSEGTGPSDAWGIYTGRVPLLRFALDSTGTARCPATWRSLLDDVVSVSTNGGIAYICSDQVSRLYATERPGDSLRSRYRADSASTIYATAWSPMGDEIAFLEKGPSGTSLKVLDVARNTTRTVAVVQGVWGVWWALENPLSLCWLPGGAKLVFSALSPDNTPDAPTRTSLYLVGADGAGLVSLTTAPDAFDHSVSCAR